MSKNTKKTLNKGGRMKRSLKGKKAIVRGIAFQPEVLEAIDKLPQVLCGEWSRSYLINQLAANWLEIPSDYAWSDLDIVKREGVVE